MTTKLIIKSLDELKRECVFIVYEPNVLDTHGEWMSADTILKACENFEKSRIDGLLIPNLFHCKDDNGGYEATDAFEIQKSWVTPVECMIGDTDVKEGTWLVKIKIASDVLWDAFLKDDVKGVSIGAMGKVGT